MRKGQLHLGELLLTVILIFILVIIVHIFLFSQKVVPTLHIGVSLPVKITGYKYQDPLCSYELYTLLRANTDHGVPEKLLSEKNIDDAAKAINDEFDLLGRQYHILIREIDGIVLAEIGDKNLVDPRYSCRQRIPTKEKDLLVIMYTNPMLR